MLNPIPPYRPAHFSPRRNSSANPAESHAFFYDDFVGDSLGAEWDILNLIGSATEEIVSGVPGGVMELALTDDSEGQDAGLLMNDIRQFDLKKTLLVEFRLAFTVLPTSGSRAVFGMAGDHLGNKDAITEAAWFKLDGDGALLIETDDTTTDNSLAADDTLVAGTFYVFLIDFSKLEDVKFLVNGKRKLPDTALDMTQLTDAEALMQPYFSLDKSSGASVGTMQIDYFKAWQDR